MEFARKDESRRDSHYNLDSLGQPSDTYEIMANEQDKILEDPPFVHPIGDVACCPSVVGIDLRETRLLPPSRELTVLGDLDKRENF